MRALAGSWLACVLLLGCAASTTNQTQPTITEDVVDDEAEAAALAEMERQIEAEARKARKAQLEAIYKKANLVQMADDERARVKTAAMAELARVEFEAGNIDEAEVAIGRAIEVAQVSGNAKIQASLLQDRLLIKRYAAFETAKRGDLDKSLAMFDKLSLIPTLSVSQRQAIGGDKLLVMEMRGGEDKFAKAAYRAALARMLGPIERSTPSSRSNGSPMPESATGRMSSEELRRSLGASIGRDVGEAALPSFGGGPIAETGRLSQSVILQVVSANKKSVAICYNRSLKSGERLRGKLEMSVRVEPKGTVSDATVKTSKFRGTALAKCIASTVMRWRFPPFGGESAEVVVPFVLSRTL